MRCPQKAELDFALKSKLVRFIQKCIQNTELTINNQWTSLVKFRALMIPIIWEFTDCLAENGFMFFMEKKCNSGKLSNQERQKKIVRVTNSLLTLPILTLFKVDGVGLIQLWVIRLQKSILKQLTDSLFSIQTSLKFFFLCIFLTKRLC